MMWWCQESVFYASISPPLSIDCNISSTSFNLHQVLKVPLAVVESPDGRKCNSGLLSCDDTRKQGCVCGPAGSQSYPGPPCNVSTSSCNLSSYLPSPPPPTMSPPTMFPQCHKLCLVMSLSCCHHAMSLPPLQVKLSKDDGIIIIIIISSSSSSSTSTPSLPSCQCANSKTRHCLGDWFYSSLLSACFHPPMVVSYNAHTLHHSAQTVQCSFFLQNSHLTVPTPFTTLVHST